MNQWLFFASAWLGGCFLASVWLKGNQTRTKNNPVVGFRFGFVEWLFLGFGLVESQPNLDQKQTCGCFFASVSLMTTKLKQKMNQWFYFGFGLVERQLNLNKKGTSGWFSFLFG